MTKAGYARCRPLVPCRPLELRRLYSAHYFEYSGACTFPGERHAFSTPALLQ